MKRTILIITVASILGLVTMSAFGTSTSPSSNPEKSEGASELKWYTDFTQAHELSQKTGKPIFGFFTGSDWCGWCKRLQANVFAKENFKEWADKSVILLELDFPRRTQLPPKVMQQNRELAQLFKVKGYPTVWIFNAVKDPKTNQMSINALGSLGYPRAEAGKESVKFVADANAILANKK
ncbi:MAG: thioredoxin family protein [Flavobacteriales bacterium]